MKQLSRSIKQSMKKRENYEKLCCLNLEQIDKENTITDGNFVNFYCCGKDDVQLDGFFTKESLKLLIKVIEKSEKQLNKGDCK